VDGCKESPRSARFAAGKGVGSFVELPTPPRNGVAGAPPHTKNVFAGAPRSPASSNSLPESLSTARFAPSPPRSASGTPHRAAPTGSAPTNYRHTLTIPSSYELPTSRGVPNNYLGLKTKVKGRGERSTKNRSLAPVAQNARDASPQPALCASRQSLARHMCEEES